MTAYVLICDDDPTIGLILKAHLSSRGFDCTVVHSATEALAILGQGRIQVLVTDLDMPGMDGIELLRAMRTQGVITRSVVVTGYATIGNLTACLREGVVALVPKPLTNFTALDQAVDQAINQMERWSEQMKAIIRMRPASNPGNGALEPKSTKAR
ncbi:hypothetical protein LBMAG53_18240 [Planctomycetota bacterium]|nr:hypothetical protein LBMAG53_18240 [Planctomycetota bacterium]